MIRRMENIVESKLCWNDWYKAYDYIAMVSAPTKPKYMRWEKYNSLLSELTKTTEKLNTTLHETKGSGLVTQLNHEKFRKDTSKEKK